MTKGHKQPPKTPVRDNPLQREGKRRMRFLILKSETLILLSEEPEDLSQDDDTDFALKIPM